MKVCTDACILGALVAHKIESGKLSPKNILDIGSGTGLLSLMIAQKTSAQITAVEINTDAYHQAKQNIERSTWKENINIHNNDIAEFSGDVKYDLIICNPPFYENDLKSPTTARNEAMHADGLTFNQLAFEIKKNLSEPGKAAVLLPAHRLKDFEEALITEGLFIEEEMQIAHSPTHKFFRTILMISFKPTDIIKTILFIKDESGEYSVDFTALLRNYYLNF